MQEQYLIPLSSRRKEMSREICVIQNVQLTELHNEAILFSIDSGVYYSLDEIGLDIWSLISNSRDSIRIKEIEDYLLITYQISEHDKETISADVKDFIYSLESKGLVKIT
ncbi:PqqD family protein [Priestia megaterium]|nr:PqqD family protein [Priestia megaterium]